MLRPVTKAICAQSRREQAPCGDAPRGAPLTLAHHEPSSASFQQHSATHLASDDQDAVCAAWVVLHEGRAVIHLRPTQCSNASTDGRCMCQVFTENEALFHLMQVEATIFHSPGSAAVAHWVCTNKEILIMPRKKEERKRCTRPSRTNQADSLVECASTSAMVTLREVVTALGGPFFSYAMSGACQPGFGDGSSGCCDSHSCVCKKVQLQAKSPPPVSSSGATDPFLKLPQAVGSWSNSYLLGLLDHLVGAVHPAADAGRQRRVLELQRKLPALRRGRVHLRTKRS